MRDLQRQQFLAFRESEGEYLVLLKIADTILYVDVAGTCCVLRSCRCRNRMTAP